MIHDRRPVSARRAFALALDLAVRRDALQSLLVPLLLRAPWVIALAMMSGTGDTDTPGREGLVWLAAFLGDAVTELTINAMLRVRARSVVGAAPGARPAPASECYARGLTRVPWLFLTELVRWMLIGLGFVALVVPGLFASFRLAVATEAVVLDAPHLSAAFRTSYRITAGRLGSWFGLLLLSIAYAVGTWFGFAAILLVARVPGDSWAAIGFLAAGAIWPIIQYAWTFYYLALAEADSPGIEVGPLYAAGPVADAPAPEPGPVEVPGGATVASAGEDAWALPPGEGGGPAPA